MREWSPAEDLIDRLLDPVGVVDLPDDERRLGALLVATRSPASTDELAGEAAALAMFRAVGPGRPVRPVRRRRRRRAAFGVGAVVAVMTSGAAAANGSLPTPAQEVASSVLGQLGIDVPDGHGDEGADATVVRRQTWTELDRPTPHTPVETPPATTIPVPAPVPVAPSTDGRPRSVAADAAPAPARAETPVPETSTPEAPPPGSSVPAALAPEPTAAPATTAVPATPTTAATGPITTPVAPVEVEPAPPADTTTTTTTTQPNPPAGGSPPPPLGNGPTAVDGDPPPVTTAADKRAGDVPPVGVPVRTFGTTDDWSSMPTDAVASSSLDAGLHMDSTPVAGS